MLRIKKWAKLLAVFFAGQSLVQIIGLVTGFLLMRWMSVESYAQFSVAFGFQSLIAAFADLGFAGSILALAGTRAAQPEVLGEYIATAKYYRRWLFMLVAPIALVLMPVLMTRQGWPWGTQVALTASVLCAVYAQGYSSIYSAPLLAHQRLKQSYQSQAVAATARLGGNALMHALSVLTAATASWAATLTAVFTAVLFRRDSHPLVSIPAAADPKLRKEMRSYVAPLIPGIVFTAFQGQITLFIISTFGQQQNIAEVAALGRLGQVFAILGSLNAVVIGPYFAKLPSTLLARRYAQCLLVTMLGCGLVVLAAYVFPGPLLWILGPKYAHLHEAVLWTMGAWALGHIGGVLWTIHSARKWIYWWITWTYIACILVAQIIVASLLPLSTTINVIVFSIITSLVIILVHAANAIYGFIQDHKHLSSQ